MNSSISNFLFLVQQKNKLEQSYTIKPENDTALIMLSQFLFC